MKRKISTSYGIDREQASRYLADIAEGLRHDGFFIQRGDEYISLRPPEEIHLEVKARKKEERESLTISLSWQKSEPASEATALRITSERPKDAISLDADDTDDETDA